MDYIKNDILTLLKKEKLSEDEGDFLYNKLINLLKDINLEEFNEFYNNLTQEEQLQLRLITKLTKPKMNKIIEINIKNREAQFDNNIHNFRKNIEKYIQDTDDFFNKFSQFSNRLTIDDYNKLKELYFKLKGKRFENEVATKYNDIRTDLSKSEVLTTQLHININNIVTKIWEELHKKKRPEKELIPISDYYSPTVLQFIVSPNVSPKSPVKSSKKNSPVSIMSVPLLDHIKNTNINLLNESLNKTTTEFPEIDNSDIYKKTQEKIKEIKNSTNNTEAEKIYDDMAKELIEYRAKLKEIEYEQKKKLMDEEAESLRKAEELLVKEARQKAKEKAEQQKLDELQSESKLSKEITKKEEKLYNQIKVPGSMNYDELDTGIITEEYNDIDEFNNIYIEKIRKLVENINKLQSMNVNDFQESLLVEYKDNLGGKVVYNIKDSLLQKINNTISNYESHIQTLQKSLENLRTQRDIPSLKTMAIDVVNEQMKTLLLQTQLLKTEGLKQQQTIKKSKKQYTEIEQRTILSKMYNAIVEILNEDPIDDTSYRTVISEFSFLITSIIHSINDERGNITKKDKEAVSDTLNNFIDNPYTKRYHGQSLINLIKNIQNEKTIGNINDIIQLE